MKTAFPLLLVVMFASCGKRQQSDKPYLNKSDVLHNNMNALTQVIIHDVFSPPVASRIYAYTSIAAYEAIRYSEKGAPSLTANLHGFPAMPEPEKNKDYNFLLAATKAFFTVAEKITFSVDTLKKYELPLYEDYEEALDEETYQRSIAFGEEVGKKVLERTTVDNYKKTRGMSKYLGSNEKGQWRPTPPDYLDGAEPYWNHILPLALDSCSQFKATPAFIYSIDTTSEFSRMVYEVYTIGKNLTPEQKTIAKYWDDNPFVIEHSGHLMFGNKKITPVGHWIGISCIAAKMKNADPVKSAKTYALTATAIFDAFIACWDEKYKSKLVRPITVINEMIDQNWQPYLQTPPFPEHTSGHSAISAAAATILTDLYGNNFAFEDTSDLAYIGMKRNFESFQQAAQEASISRVYGGIHYSSGINAGADQGNRIAQYILAKLNKK